jgi:hypothetical protein
MPLREKQVIPMGKSNTYQANNEVIEDFLQYIDDILDANDARRNRLAEERTGHIQ